MGSDQIWEKIRKGVFIIAEAGKNFIQTEAGQPVEVYLKNAMQLADEAKKAGADAIKFQTHVVEDEILDIHVDSPHFPNWKKGRRAWVDRNERSTPIDSFWKPLKAYCEKIGITFFSTPMSRKAAQKLMEVGIPLWKVGSGDILDLPLLDYIRQTNLPIIMSSGMSTIEEVKKGLSFLQNRNNRVALMHCLSKYPGLPEEANLAIMELYREKFPETPIGFSENSLGIEPAVLAVTLGATMVEKHITLRRDLWGPDHKVSSTPEEFKKMVEAIRKLESDLSEKQRWLKYPTMSAVLGKKEKVLQEGEEVFRPLFRKALMAGCDIPAGAIITADMLYAMRPQGWAGGLASEYYDLVVGKKTKKDFKKYDPINFENLS